MPLSDEDARQVYDTLAKSARDIRLDWIVDQVEEQIALGSVDVKSLAVSERDLFFDEGEIFTATPQSRKRTKGTFAVSRPYSSQEKLELLIESLLIGVVELNQVEDELVTFAVSELESSTIEFAPEAEVKSTFRLDTSGHSFRRSASEKLTRLLNELKEEI